MNQGSRSHQRPRPERRTKKIPEISSRASGNLSQEIIYRSHGQAASPTGMELWPRVMSILLEGNDTTLPPS
jgi:hypothetical protein